MWRSGCLVRRVAALQGRRRVATFDATSGVLRSPLDDVHIPDLCLADFVWQNAHKWPQRTALICGVSGHEVTYGQAQATSEAVGSALVRHLALRAGDTVGLVMPNVPQFPLVLLGATSAGLVASPANPLYTPEELARQFEAAKVRAVVTVAPLASKVQEALEMVPGGGGPVVVVGPGGGAAPAPRDGSVLELDALLGRGWRPEGKARPHPDSVAVLPFSSGTTGLPKGVRLSHRNLVANLCQMMHHQVTPLQPEDLEQDRALAILPFFHIYGMNGVMNLSLTLGRCLITLPRFDAKMFQETFSKFKPTVVSLVPPLCAFLAQSISPDDLAHLRIATCGAASLPGTVVQQLLHKAGENLDFKEGYGLTESSCLVTSPLTSHSMEQRLGNVGAPISQTEVKIVDIYDETKVQPLGGIGEIHVRGPQIMLGYLDDEEATNDVLTKDGWLRTGDIGLIDANGFIKLVDRAKELIKVKGLQVSPTELEAILQKMEGVADVAVIGVPDEEAGELPRAFVVRKLNSRISGKDVDRFLEPHVAPFKQLRGGIRFVEHIPKNAAGKILRPELKKLK